MNEIEVDGEEFTCVHDDTCHLRSSEAERRHASPTLDHRGARGGLRGPADSIEAAIESLMTTRLPPPARS